VSDRGQQRKYLHVECFGKRTTTKTAIDSFG